MVADFVAIRIVAKATFSPSRVVPSLLAEPESLSSKPVTRIPAPGNTSSPVMNHNTEAENHITAPVFTVLHNAA